MLPLNKTDALDIMEKIATKQPLTVSERAAVLLATLALNLDQPQGRLRHIIEQSIGEAVAEEAEAWGKKVDDLQKALRPFAEQAKIIDAQRQDGEQWADYAWFRFGTSVTAMTLGDCRRAANLTK